MVFAGGSPEAQAGFDPGRMLWAIGVSSQGAMSAIMNRLARPNDLGFKEFGDMVQGYKADLSGERPLKEVKEKKSS